MAPRNAPECVRDLLLTGELVDQIFINHEP